MAVDMEESTETAVAPQQEGAEQAKPLGPYQQSDDRLVEIIMGWFREAEKAKREALRKRKIDKEMYAGKQWADGDSAANRTIRRPELTINLILTIISAVEGEERTDRQELKFYGNGEDDDSTAESLNLILKWIMQGCGGEFSLSAQFRDEAKIGQGWVVPEVDYFEDPEGKIKLVYVPDPEIFEDPLSKSPVADGDRYIHRVKQITEDELEARWPGKCAELKETMGGTLTDRETDGKGYRDIYLVPNDVDSPKLYSSTTKMWTITETWWFQIEEGWVYVNEQTGLLEEASDEEFQVMKKQREDEIQAARMAMLAQSMMPQPAPVFMGGQPMMAAPPPPIEIPKPLEATRRPLKRFYQAFTCYKTLLEKNPSPLKRLKRLIYVPARAFFDDANNEWFGLTRNIIDVQKQHNVETTIIVQLMQLMPKGNWMGPKGSFANKQEWQGKLGMTGQLLEYNPSRGKPEPVPTAPIPRHLIDMAFQRPQMMREISGVNVELTGQRQGNDAGVVMQQRTKAAKTVLSPLFDNYRHSKIELGKVLLAYIQTYVSVGRRIRVLGPKRAQTVTMTEDMTIGQYDVTVEETNSDINDRIATLNILQTTLPQMMKAGIPIPPSFVDLMPMPVHLRDEWKRQMSWQLALSGQTPPPNWNPGDPIPIPGAPQMGAPPPEAPPQL